MSFSPIIFLHKASISCFDGLIPRCKRDAIDADLWVSVHRRHRQAAPAPRVRAAAGAGVPAAAGPASQDPRHTRRAPGDLAEGQAPGRPAPGLLRVRRAQGGGQAQDHLRARLRFLQIRRAPGLAGMRSTCLMISVPPWNVAAAAAVLSDL